MTEHKLYELMWHHSTKYFGTFPQSVFFLNEEDRDRYIRENEGNDKDLAYSYTKQTRTLMVGKPSQLIETQGQ